MDTSDWLFKTFPFLFRSKMRDIKSNLEKMLEQRFTVVTDTLQIQNVTKPILRLTLKDFCFYQNKSIYFSYHKIFETQDNIVTILDHELAHYVQHSVNTKIKKYYPLEFLSFFYWLFTGRLWWGFRRRAFEEGFAVYTAHITSGRINAGTKRQLELLQKSNRFRVFISNMLSLPYVAGYLAYRNLGDKKSQKYALEVGLYDHPKELND
jgi:hypothetical protein